MASIQIILTVVFILIIPKPIHSTNLISIDCERSTGNLKKLKRFWINTGFSPLHNDADFFESSDLNLNLEIIGSLPNNGLRNVRIHWLLDLVTVKRLEDGQVDYNFEKLDKFLQRLVYEYDLLPTIEFMTSTSLGNLSRDFWDDYAYKIVSHFVDKFGPSNVLKWNLETWNEPDLTSYNKQNFTLSDYQDYISGIRAGLNRVSHDFSLKKKLKLRGPAGLFRDNNKHKFCWNVLENCNANVSSCPVDIITFHRKGNGNEANEIIDGSLELLQALTLKFPNLSEMKFSNTEADPIKTWSEPRDFQADARYASILVETVFQHWSAMYDGRMSNLDSISHDNSFMNYYPNIFTQRTLLARMQINNTLPAHVQFVRKPVLTALGMLANLGQFSASPQSFENFSYIFSINNDTKRFFSCIIIASHVDNRVYANKTKNYEFEIKNLSTRQDLLYLVEVIDNKRTNPSRVFEMLNRPKYPDFNDLKIMRNVQGPIYIEEPSKVVDGKIFFNVQLMEPFVISIRICSINSAIPKRVRKLRIRKINSEEIVLFWSDSFYKERCIKTYEIFFKYDADTAYSRVETKHLPFLYHQFKHTIPGCFKVRSKDMNNRYSRFSREKCIL